MYFSFQAKGEYKHAVKPYNDVQFSVHSEGLFGELGPSKVSPHLIPLHVLICEFEIRQCKR